MYIGVRRGEAAGTDKAAGLYQHTDTRPTVFPLDANMNAIRLGVAPADKSPSGTADVALDGGHIRT